MSRRESRVSMNSRQNDALFEFENFKKKFLLANKHITKLNSTLSVRIEELNAQISTLYVENLRLRASEIALAAQLKREREKSRKVMNDAEAASLNLTKQLNYLRQSLNIKQLSPEPPTPPSPRARRPPPPSIDSITPTSPPYKGIARPPNVPGIFEEDEPCASSSEYDVTSPSRRKTKSKPRLSASKLPLPARVPEPTPFPTPIVHAPLRIDLVSAAPSKRKPSRRQSGLLSINTDSLAVPRAASPAFGSPIRLEAGLAEEAEEMAAISGRNVNANDDSEMEGELDDEIEKSMLEKEKRRKSKAKEREADIEMFVQPVRAKRQREDDDGMDAPKLKLKDVTNARVALQPIDNTVHEPVDIESPSRPSLGVPSQPNSRGPPSPCPSDGDGAIGGRERRTRKSVNYAEPKLNTKMRKPDSFSGSDSSRASKKRSSAAAVLTSYKPTDDNGNDADNDTEARSSLELPLRVNGAYINPEAFPLPPSRPGSTMGLYSPGPPAKSGAVSSSSSSGSTTMKRKKSRPRLVLDDDDSDGAHADAEYIGGKGLGVVWVNTESRRKTGVKKAITVLDTNGRIIDSDGRRHSMAV